MRSIFSLLIPFLVVSACNTGYTSATPSDLKVPLRRDTVESVTAHLLPGNTKPTYDTSSHVVRELKKVFRIEKENGNSIFLQLYVYLADRTKVEDVTRYLRLRYAASYTQAFDIWFFDKKNIADRYLKAVDDRNLGDEAFAAIDKHIICQYSWAGLGEGSYDYNNP